MPVSGDAVHSCIIRRILPALLFVLCTSLPALGQDLVYVSAFGDTVYFVPPEPTRWELAESGLTEDESRFVLTWKRTPITDSAGRSVQPVIALILEVVSDKTDVLDYSVMKRLSVPFEVAEVFAGDSETFAYANSIGYAGFYDRLGVRHSVLVSHMVHDRSGIQIICDSTEELFDLVESDMRDFVASILFDD